MIEQILSGNVTLVLLAVAAAMFLWLAIKSRNLKSFQFQISVFVIIWIAGEIVDVLHENSQADLGDGIGMEIHLGSMIFLSSVLWLRYYTAKKGGKKMIERLEDYDN